MTQGHRVDMSNLVFHTSMAKHLKVTARCGGDKEIFKMLLAAGGEPKVLTVNDTGGVGIWANSRGAGKGGLILTWTSIGTRRPTMGKEILNGALSEHLRKAAERMQEPQLPPEVMQSFTADQFQPDAFIKVREQYYRPVTGARANATERSSFATGCTPHVANVAPAPSKRIQGSRPER